MKALSVRPEWAMSIWTWDKQIECRTWKTDYRGQLLICSSSKKTPGCISGHALCVVELVDIVPFEKKHLDLALMDQAPDSAYAWILDGPIETTGWVKPFPVKGKLHLYDVEDEKIEILPADEKPLDLVEKYFEPLVYLPTAEDKEFWEYVKSGWRQ